jgi:hypothetical protein
MDQSATLAMWAILKMHIVMETYLTHKFEDHPSIATENVHFLMYILMGAGQGDADVEVKQLKKQLEKVEDSKKLLQSNLVKLGARLEKLENLKAERRAFSLGEAILSDWMPSSPHPMAMRLKLCRVMMNLGVLTMTVKYHQGGGYVPQWMWEVC